MGIVVSIKIANGASGKKIAPEENWQSLILWKNLAEALPFVDRVPTKQMDE